MKKEKDDERFKFFGRTWQDSARFPVAVLAKRLKVSKGMVSLYIY